jgi:NTP pyrophosphatase (non-canonical NTP hydrolase)
MTDTKTFAEMAAEVEAYCRDKGWYDQEVPFFTAMALLHEEIAEAGHAWRDNGLKDMTPHSGEPEKNCKPEGVGSEFADILIRLLDDDTRYDLDLPLISHRTRGIPRVTGEFMIDVNMLHGLVARASMEWSDHPSFSAINLAGLLGFLELLCERYGIDLRAEYERKMRYNRTRPYRHGGRRA